MTSQADFVQPPRIAAWLVTLFTPAEETESILGDLLEEFSQLASKSGVAYARRWYRRQTLKTIAHLVVAGFRAAPWSTAAAVIAGLFLIRFGFGLYGQAVEAALDRFRVYEYISDLGSQQPSVNVAADYVSWINLCRLIGRVFVAALFGGLVALAARGREMTATIAIGLFLSALGVASCVMMLARAGDYEFLFPWVIPYVFGDSIPIVVGGAIMRTLRSGAAIRPSTT